MPRKVLTLCLPAQSTVIDGDLALDLEDSVVEKRIGSILRPVMQAALHACEVNPSAWKTRAVFSFTAQELRFGILASRVRDPLPGFDEPELVGKTFANVLIRITRAVQIHSDAIAQGLESVVTYVKAESLRVDHANPAEIVVHGPAMMKRAFDGVMALVRRLASGGGDVISLGMNAEVFDIAYTRPAIPTGNTEQRNIDGVVTSVDDLRSMLQLTDMSTSPHASLHLHLDKADRAAALDLQKQRAVVRARAEVTLRGRKAVSGRILSLAAMDTLTLVNGNDPSLRGKRRRRR